MTQLERAKRGITTDIAPGYDHITSAIGAALSSAYGADFICYVTPVEHLGLPFPEDVKQGVITARIAAYIGDMVKLKRRDRDKEMSIARRDLDWHKQFELAIAKDEAVRIRSERQPSAEDSCTMCGQFCASRILKGMFDDEIRNGGKC